MALQKDIKMPNGVTLGYHKISMIKIDLSQQISILVDSYVDEKCRVYEKDYASGNIVGEPVFPYIQSNYLNIEYMDGIDLLTGNVIENFYNWLKEQPNYDGSKDI